jgi:hypothetical protein
MATTVTVGPNAQVFHDATTGVTVCKGEVVTLRSSQLASPKIKQALSTGHLILSVQPEKSQAITSDSDIAKLDKKIQAQYKKGVEISKIALDVTLEQAKQLANKYKVEVEDNDTVEDILEVILKDE